MKEIPFSPEIQRYKKPVEVGDTNDIYYDPQFPDAVIRVPTDKEARFLEMDTKLIAVAERIYTSLDRMGERLDIAVAPHQFIVAKETSDGPVKPMLIAKRIEGHPLFPLDKDDPRTLEDVSRIAQLGFMYLSWIESQKPRSVVTDIFRPDQYIAEEGETHDKLTLIDIEPRLKEREYGKQFLDYELGMLVAPLRDTNHNDTFNKYMHHVFKTLKQNLGYHQMISLVNIIINNPEIYQEMSDDFLSGQQFPDDYGKKFEGRIKTPHTAFDQALLKKFGIEKI